MRAFRNQPVESLLTEWNLRFELIEAVPLDTIVQVDEVQARAVAHRAVPEDVEAYYEHMKNGAQFPPIVLREPKIMLDGNTRKAAAEKLGMQAFPAYIVRDIPNTEMARALSGAINQLGGRRLTGAEAQEIAVDMLYGEMKLPVNVVARYVGRSGAQITKWRKDAEVLNRAQRLGILDEVESISANQRQKLEGVQFDEPFRRIIDALAVSKPPASELTALVKDVGKVTSEQEAIDLVDTATTQWRPTGPGGDGRVIRNEKARRARMLIPQLLNLRPSDLFDESKADDDRKMWERLGEQVAAVLRAFEVHTAQSVMDWPRSTS
jgi:hypothetical protein